MILKSGIPVITVSYAQSIDGRIASSTGDSRWISGPETLILAHELRRDNDAILTGIGTVMKDDPELSCRLPGIETSPVRIILDSNLRIPLTSRIVQTARKIRTVVVALPGGNDRKRRALEKCSVEILFIGAESDEQRPSIGRVVQALGELGLMSIYIEGGGGIITSFLRAGLVDRMLIVTAPLLIGKGIEAIGDLGTKALTEAIVPEISSFKAAGKDLIWDLTLKRRITGAVE